MKKLALAIVMVIGGTISAHAQAAGTTTMTVDGGVLASSSTAAQAVAVASGATAGALAFTTFNVTISKGVSAVGVSDVPNNAVKIYTKHYNSANEYGGSTKGGSVAQCGAAGTAFAAAGADISATVPAAADAGCPTS